MAKNWSIHPKGSFCPKGTSRNVWRVYGLSQLGGGGAATGIWWAKVRPHVTPPGSQDPGKALVLVGLTVSSEHHSVRPALLGSPLFLVLFSHLIGTFSSSSQRLKTFKAVIKCHFFQGALQDAPIQNQLPFTLCTYNT